LTFLPGQLLGSLLDSTVLLFFLPVMFFLSPLVTTFILMICAVIVAWLVLTLPIYRRKGKWLEALQSERGSFLYQTLAGIRTVKALTLEPRQRHRFDALTHKVAKSRIEHDLFGAVVATVVRPLEMAAISGGLAVAVYICMTTEDPTLTAALFAFLLLSQRVIQPLIQIAMSLNQWDDARIAIEALGELVNRPEEEGRSREGPRPTVHGQDRVPERDLHLPRHQHARATRHLVHGAGRDNARPGGTQRFRQDNRDAAAAAAESNLPRPDPDRWGRIARLCPRKSMLLIYLIFLFCPVARM
jgi:ABC-type bacteriocin/lantibiotic exporter with double-glycine peptidase domain